MAVSLADNRFTSIFSVTVMREMRNAYKIWVRKPERKRPLRRPMHRWEDNIRIGRCGLDSSGLG
jgi:hypothetical protein